MALFKIEKGQSTNLATARPTTHEGWCYFTTDDGKFYIDVADGNDLSARVCLNAAKADTWKEARNFTITDGTNTGTATSVDGGANVSLKLPTTIKATLSGNASSASKWQTARNFTITDGTNTGSVTSVNGTEAVSLNLPTTIKATLSGNASSASKWATARNFAISDGTNTGTATSVNGTGAVTLSLPTTIKATLSGNASSASKLTAGVVGNNEIPVYFNNGVPVACSNGKYLPVSAGENNKLIGPLGLTSGVNYDSTLPTQGFDGQLFFLEDDSPVLPSGGTAGQYLVKNSSTDGDASWKNLPSLNYLPLTGGTVNGDISVDQLTITNTSGVGHINFSRVSSYNYIYLPSGESQNGKVAVCIGPTLGSNESQIVIDKTSIIPGTTNTIDLGTSSKKWNTIYGSKVYGAVYNDYAEYRSQIENIEPGYCVFSADNGSVSKTTEKFQACDGIVSDTFGFAIGETDECKTPLAVAGRVLAYCEGSRYDYHSGDTVCAGPDGKVCKMTREEIKEYPDRIVGIVSEIPNYETWGTENTKVNGRIWIKIK